MIALLDQQDVKECIEAEPTQLTTEFNKYEGKSITSQLYL